MTRLARVRSPGDWTGDLLPADLAALDDRQFHAITKRGGTWAPHDSGFGGSNFIGIGGAQGLEITGPSRLDKVVGMDLATGVQIGYASRSVTREQSLYRARTRGFGPVDGDRSGFLDGTFGPSWRRAPMLVQTSVSPAAVAVLPLRIPVGSSVSRIDVTCRSLLANDRDFAALMPHVKLSRADHQESANSTNVISDPSSTLDEYRAEHVISIVPSGSPIYDGTKRWNLIVIGEYGENSHTGFAVSSVRTTITQTLHDEWQI